MAMVPWTRRAAVALCISSLGLSACNSEPAPTNEAVELAAGITVTGARLVLPPVSGNPAAAYFTLSNQSGEAVSLTGVTVSGAGNAMLHQSVMVDGRMTMSHAGILDVQSGGQLVFEPGGFHVMAFDLDDSVVAGGTVEITLAIEGADDLTIEAEVRAAGDAR